VLGLHGSVMGAPHRSRCRTGYGARRHGIFDAKQRGGHEESYLGFGRCEVAVPRARGDGVLPCLTDFDESGALAIFWTKGGVGWHQRPPTVHLL
jgi:hypothetical protein